MKKKPGRTTSGESNMSALTGIGDETSDFETASGGGEEYDDEIDVDTVIEANSVARSRENERKKEAQSQLHIAHQNKTLQAQIQHLQEQVARLQCVAGLQADEDEQLPVPLIMIGRHTPDQEQARSRASKSVSFSSSSSEVSEEDEEAIRQALNPQSSQADASNTGPSDVSMARSRSTRESRRRRRRQSSAVVPQGGDQVGENEADLLLLEQHLSEDTFGFLLATPVRSIPFYLGTAVLFFQILIYMLMVFNLLDLDSPNNIFGIPANVPEPVWIAQIIAIIIAVIMQDDIRTGLDMLREGYSQEMQEAFPHSNGWKFALSVTTRLIGGSMGLITNFLLIVTSSTVIDLLLNFTALAFVGQLDEAAFFLSKQGFAGATCLTHATLVTETVYHVPKTFVQARKTFMMVSILIIMMAAWGFVRYQQTEGQFLCGTLIVQMGDELRPEMGTFAGLYDLQNSDGFLLKSKHVTYIDRAAGNTRFSYCDSSGYWTLQWKSSPDVEFPDSPCDGWQARSSKTDNYALTAAVDAEWYVRDEYDRETILEPFFLLCFDCDYIDNPNTGSSCTGRGTCSNAVCTCDAGWFGLRCEFVEPCPTLQLDAREGDTFLKNNEIAAQLNSGLEILMDDSQDPPRMILSYDRPVYAGHLIYGHHLLFFFTGRRWVGTHTGLLLATNLNETIAAFSTLELGRANLFKFFDSFHAHWTTYGVEHISEPMDFGTPENAATPVAMLFYEAIERTSINQTEMQAPNEASPMDARLICGTCDDTHNPCYFDGICSVDGTCVCAIGAAGSLCERSPVRNGRCDAYYNIPYFEFDGGDCCDSTCVSTHEFTCGEEIDGYVNIGYPNCRLPRDRWQKLHDSHIFGDPLSLSGYSVALSQSGTLMAMGEPEQSRVRLYDKDGSEWIERELLEGLPGSNFGVSMVLSGGPVHWRHNPVFRAPLLLMIGVAKKREPTHVEIFKCGVDVQCHKVDQIENVHGSIGPEAFDMSNDGRVVAYALAEPGAVEVYEIPGDYYEGNRTIRQAPVELAAPEMTNETTLVRLPAVTALRLSEHGDVMAVIQEFPTRSNTLRVYKWDGTSYQPKGGLVMETNAEVLQRQLALSADGSTLAVGISTCPSLDILVYKWDLDTLSWQQQQSPPLGNELCDGDFLAWSVALSHHGLTLAVAAYPNSNTATVFEWIENSWQIQGDPIPGDLPGSQSAIALSADGAHLVVGLPYSGTMESGSVATYSLSLSHCPSGLSHHFRLSLTTDYEPENILWQLEDTTNSRVQMKGGPYKYQTATLVEEICIDTKICHAFTMYNLGGPYGIESPGRYDLFLDGEDFDRSSFSGLAKRVFMGTECMTCSEGSRLLRTMVRTCQQAEWKLVDETGVELVGGSTPADHFCTGPESVEGYFWEDTCIDPSKCYTFMATDTTSTEENSTGFDYVILLDDDVLVAADKSSVASVSVKIGVCNARKL